MSIPAFLLSPHAEEDTLNEHAGFLSDEEASVTNKATALAGQIQACCGVALSEFQLQQLRKALLQVPEVCSSELPELGWMEPFLEKALTAVATSSDAKVILFAWRSGLQKLSRSDVAVWCCASRALADFQRIHKISSRDRSEDDNRYMNELENVISSTLYRHLPIVPNVAKVQALTVSFPNFSEPIRFIAEQAALAHFRNHSEFRLPAMLFVGPPGIGKTSFALALAELLGSQVETIDMAGASSGMMISGLDRGWGTARPGIIYTTIAWGKSLSPIVILDEIDKVSGSTNHNPTGSLFQLLEPSTAANFRDEFVGFSIDASRVVWIATANDLSQVPSALRSRFQVFHIECPDERELRVIAADIYAKMAENLPGAPKGIPDAWADRLGVHSLREVRIILQRAFGRAAIRAASMGLDVLDLHNDDLIVESKTQTNHRIGF